MADGYVYRITYLNGTVKNASRRQVGAAVGWEKGPGTAWRKGGIVKIERAPEPGWEDVTAEFLPCPDGP